MKQIGTLAPAGNKSRRGFASSHEPATHHHPAGPLAEDDIAEAKAWYNRQRNGLGDNFVLCVEAALDRIRNIPNGATEVYPGVRRVVLRRFPYGVLYRVDPDQIAVLAVYHSKRDPRGWQSRT